MKIKKHAFTLIELLVVIVIIGVLATVSVATFSSYQKKSRDAKRYAELSQMAKLINTEVTINELKCGSGNAFSARPCIMNIIKKGGVVLPPAEKDCYVYGFNKSNPEEFFVISSEQYLDKILVFYGPSPIGNLFDTNAPTSDHYKGTNFYYMSLYIKSYKSLNCDKTGNSVNFYINTDGDTLSYFLTPLNPALQ